MNMTTQTYSDLESIINEAIMARTPSVVLPPDTESKEIDRIIKKFVQTHPDVNWFPNRYRWDAESSTLFLDYNSSAQEIEVIENEVIVSEEETPIIVDADGDGSFMESPATPCGSSSISEDLTQAYDEEEFNEYYTPRHSGRVYSEYRVPERGHVGRSRSNRTKRPAVSTYVPAREGKKTGSGTASLFGRIFGFLGLSGLFCGSSSKARNYDEDQQDSQTVNACVYAPFEVKVNKSFIIRVYMYLPHEQAAVDAKVKEIDPSAVKKEYKPLDIPVMEGDKLTVRLKLSEGVSCKETEKSIIWRNRYADCSFMAKVVDEDLDCVEGSAYVFVNDIPAGEMLFTVDVVESQPREVYANVESRRFSKIFISYAHQDERQVRGIAEGCRMLGKDYFFDRHTLKAGDIFKDKIFQYIDGADLFVLCWSKNAAESEWVQMERLHALRLIEQENRPITIYPLSLLPAAPLPEDMSSKYNFASL